MTTMETWPKEITVFPYERESLHRAGFYYLYALRLMAGNEDKTFELV